MQKIGLTGNLGSGKSTTLKILEEIGFKTINCDHIVHELIDKDEEVFQLIHQKWSDEILCESGKIDRKKLANIVFKNEADLKYLEDILHIKVRKRWEAEMYESGESVDSWVVEIPLLFEKKLEKKFNYSVCIYAAEDIQKNRLLNKGFSLETTELRLAKQMPILEKIQLANFVVLNNGSEQFLRKQLVKLKQIIAA